MAARRPNPYRSPASTGEIGSRMDAHLYRWGLRVLSAASLLYFGVTILLLSSSAEVDLQAARLLMINLLVLAIWNVLAFARLPGRAAWGMVATVVQVGTGFAIWYWIPGVERGAVLAINGTFVVGFVVAAMLLSLARRLDRPR